MPKVTAQGVMELWRRPEQLEAVRADLDKNVPVAGSGNDPLLRARSVHVSDGS